MKKFFQKVSLIFNILFAVLVCNINANSKINSSITEHLIPIAMATDSNYIYPTLVAMTSILENKNDDTYLDFHIMLSGEVSKDDKDKIKLLENLYQNCSVKLIDMKNKSMFT